MSLEFSEFGKALATTFGIVFLAELGDKAQLATLLIAADQPGLRWAVFLGAAAALTLAAAIGVVAGAWIAYHVPIKALKLTASMLFIVMGLLTLRSAMPF